MPTASLREKILVFAILFSAFLLRIWGIGFGLPGLYHADEAIVLNHALAYGTGDFNPHFFKIPPLVSYLLFGVFGLYYVAGKLTGFFTSTADFEALFFSDPSSFYLIARVIFGAMAGTLTVYLFYRSIRSSFGKLRALLAAFLLAVCFLHVTDSHYLYADIPLLLILVAAFGFFWQINEKSSWKTHGGAGAFVGIAAAVKYNGIFIALAYGICLFFLKNTTLSKLRKAICAGLAAFAVFSALNPYWLLDYSFFMQDIRIQAQSQGGVGWFHHFRYSLVGAAGWPLLAAAFGGVFLSFREADERLRNYKLSLLLFTIGYYGVLAAAGQPYPRYVLPLLPGILFFASDALVVISKDGRRRFVLAAGLVLLSAFPLTKSILWDQLMSRQDTRDLAKKWIEETLPQETALALDWEFYMPRLNFSQVQLEEKKASLAATHPFADVQQRRLESLETRSQSEPAYRLHFLVPRPDEQERFFMATPVLPYTLEALTESQINYVLLLPANHALAPAFYQAVREKARLIRTWSPYKDGRLEPLDTVAMTGGPFTWAEIISRQRNGHAIEIYRLDF